MRIFIPVIALAATLVASLAGCASPPGGSAVAAKTQEAEVEAFMWDYTKAWNQHDAATVAQKFYRTGPSVAEQTESLKKGFDNLVAQGYDKSAIHAIKGCITGPDTAWAGMRFSRLKKDGEPLPPKDRASSYDLKKFPDGWRITRVGGGDAAQPLECPPKA